MDLDYVDPLPPVLKFFKMWMPQTKVLGNTIPAGTELPAMLIKNAGGVDYTRLQLLCRADSGSEAMSRLITAMNVLAQYAANIEALRVEWCEKESAPVPDADEDTGKPEAWCYMALYHLES